MSSMARRACSNRVPLAEMMLYVVIVIVVSASWVGWGACGIAVPVRGRIGIISGPPCGGSGSGGNGMVDRSLGTGAVGGVCSNCMVIGDPGGDVCDLWDVCGMAILGGQCGGIAGGPHGGGGGRVIRSMVIMGMGRGVIGGGGGSCVVIDCSGGCDLVAA